MRRAGFLLLGFLVPGIVEAQTQAALPEASFEAFFRKYTPPSNVFSPFAAWDADLALRVTAVRKAASALELSIVFQTVGIDTPGSRIGVAGTGYIFRLGYTHAYSSDITLSAGVVHLSSHLTRDLDQRMARAKSEGTFIPVVTDPSEYNAPYFQVVRRFPTVRFTPEVDVRLHPVNIRLGGHQLYDIRPVYLGTRFALWRGRRAVIALETQHEVGENPFNNFIGLVELNTGHAESRLQVFVSVSPGGEVHVSPNVGGLRDGVAFGVRLRFRAA